MEEFSFFKRQAYNIFWKLYARNFTPFDLMRMFGRALRLSVKLSGKRVVKYLCKEIDHIPDEHYEPFSKYMLELCLSKGSGEYAFAIMFPHIHFCDKAIFNFLDKYKENGTPLSFHYGAKDWIDTSFTGEKISERLKRLGHKVFMVEDSSHNLYIDNPKHMFECMLEDLST